jgi:hypothetical protein
VMDGVASEFGVAGLLSLACAWCAKNKCAGPLAWKPTG